MGCVRETPSRKSFPATNLLLINEGTSLTRGIPLADGEKKILVVDDDDAIRTLLLTVLRRRGYTVDAASNGEEAIDCCMRNGYAVVLLDLMMPVVSGYDVLDRLADLPNRPAVIVATAGISNRPLNATLVAATVRKPFNIDLLLDTVRGCFREHPK